MKVKLFTSILIFLSTASSIEKEKTNPNQPNTHSNLNISFLLDLSDRIDPKKNPNPAMEYYQRDLLYIKSIEKAFIKHIKQKKVLQLKDQMQVFFDPEPKNAEINKLSQQLKVTFDKRSSKDNIKKVDELFSSIPIKIYKSAIKDNDYVGSDIWGFFKNRVREYCIKEKYRNILIIITDGYMYHEDSKLLDNGRSSYITSTFIWANKLISANYKSIIKKNNLGFIPSEKNLNELEIVVLGINPSKKNPYEEEVIKQYWSDWFKAMGVKSFYLKTADLPSNLDPVLEKIILSK